MTISVSILFGMIMCVLSGMVISMYYLEWGRAEHSAEVVREWPAVLCVCKECLLPKTVGCSNAKGILHERESRERSH
jgi:hypothetical protein